MRGSGGMGGRWLLVLLVAGMMAGECAGQGHFRFANIFWERNATLGGFVVTYTIRSSWQRTYPEFQVPSPVNKSLSPLPFRPSVGGICGAWVREARGGRDSRAGPSEARGSPVPLTLHATCALS